ncbi:Uncharacterised protein [Mycobacterium tuberculosis]|uniref:Uncharacterized protein n=1 Tax=Mycobacterium tuberculosis TaxID=1773 RepID=A0A655AFU9_MYCTX|nr:Uncharacterised protein [Mycobacterium tuberculosis]CKR70100.1 Uncharacterised protein [Mycobacterium tuberculosis]CKS25862.1 Uncharacterised protein [Mycobacterium tuberculosis]CKS34322.1 Uncharacterised protein [Mycobacterium tuberculosis]CKS59152.1 Uncharacterised protein [Mycobacterium tuberculosis]
MVFTHGFEVSPFSTALRASSAAPSITSGLEVLVQDVIAAITTAPWSSTNSPSSSDFTRTGLLTRPSACAAAECTVSSVATSSLANVSCPGSLAGNVSSTTSSSFECGSWGESGEPLPT